MPILGLALQVAVAGSVEEPPAVVRAESIPPRTENASTGTEFASRTTGWDGRRRQAAAIEQLVGGNIPDFLRTLRAVKLTRGKADTEGPTAVVWVMPDYLAIGADDDFLYIPLTFPSATRVANTWGFVLPTRKIVDAVYEQADHRLRPTPMKPGPKMRSSVYYLEHQRLIDAQRGDIPPGVLLSGHKKDVVLTNRLLAKADRIAIYGWHRRKGDPIQPLSTVHGARYADYSHGVRLVWDRVWIDGELRSIYDVLRDPELAPFLTYEEVIRTPRKIMRAEIEPSGD